MNFHGPKTEVLLHAIREAAELDLIEMQKQDNPFGKNHWWKSAQRKLQYYQELEFFGANHPAFKTMWDVYVEKSA